MGLHKMYNTKLIFLRHGQSIGNLERRLLGHTDLDLSELGYRQAESAAYALKDEKIDFIYSSSLKQESLIKLWLWQPVH